MKYSIEVLLSLANLENVEQYEAALGHLDDMLDQRLDDSEDFKKLTKLIDDYENEENKWSIL